MLRVAVALFAIAMLLVGLAHPVPARAAQLGNVTTWGNNLNGQAGTGTLGIARGLAAGANHSLAVMNITDSVYAWGDATYGQVGPGATESCGVGANYYCRREPTLIPGLSSGVKQVAAGGGFSLALKWDGTVRAWGADREGQLGNGTGSPDNCWDYGGCSHLPVNVQYTFLFIPFDLSEIAAVAAGGSHSLALARNGDVWAWGNNGSGQVGIEPYASGYRADYAIKVPGLSNVVAIAAGGNHSLALKSDGTLWAWGSNDHGQLGTGNQNWTYTPTQVLTGVAAIDAGDEHSVALKGDGTVWAWGANYRGQVGDGSERSAGDPTDIRVLSPVQVKARGADRVLSPLTGVSRIEGGGNHNFALKPDGSVWAWGANDASQLGFAYWESPNTCTSGGTDGSHPCARTAVQLPPVPPVYAIAAGGSHTMLIAPDRVPPVTTVTRSPEPNADGWNTGNVAVALNAADPVPGTGVRSITYSATGAQTIAPTTVNDDAARLTITAEGETTISYSATDNMGNVEMGAPPQGNVGPTIIGGGDDGGGGGGDDDPDDPIDEPAFKTVVVKIDRAAPTDVVGAPDRLPDAGSWYNHPVSVTFTGTDAASGIASCTSATYTGPDDAAASADGSCTDRAGNTTSATFALQYDATPPETQASVSPPAGSDGWHTGDVTVTLSAADGTGSGVASVTYSTTGAQATASTSVTGSRAEILVTAEGETNVTFAATDTAGNVETAKSLVVMLRAVDEPPAATDDTYATLEDQPLSVPAPGILGNDTDPEGMPLSASLVSGPAHGTLELSPDGSFAYTPSLDYNGLDTFTYHANDGQADSAPVTVTITVSEVNDAPSAREDSLVVAEDGSAAIDVTANDSAGPANEAGQTLTVTEVGSASHGTVSLVGGQVTYTPEANYNGSDRFGYTVADDGTTGGVADPRTATATVNVTISEVNDQPAAIDDSKSTPEDVALVFPSSDLAANDSAGPSEESSQMLTVTAASGAIHGSAVLSLDGTITFTPETNYSGPASFSYTVADNGTTAGLADPKVATAIVQVTITSVNDKPAAGSQSVTTNEDAAKGITLTGSDVETPAASLTYQVATGPQHGSLSGTGASLSYTPGPDYNGSDSFTFTVTDTGDGSAVPLTSDEATVSIRVDPVNDAPSFTKGADQTVLEDAGAQTATGWATNISRGPSDEAGQTLDFVVSNDNNALFSTQPAVSAGGTLTFKSAANASGSATVEVYLHDGGGTANGGVNKSLAQTFVIAVNAVNDAPSVSPVASQAVQYSDPIGQVTVTATDVDSASLTASTQWKVGSGSLTSGLPEGLSLSPTGAGRCAANGDGSRCTWTLGGRMLVSPGTYVVRITVGDGSAENSIDVTIVVSREDARATYTGALFASTSSTTSSTATVTLAATIQDITAVTGDPAYDAFVGDIRKATVSFVDRGAGGATLCTASLGLVSSGDTKTGTATCNWSATIGQSDSVAYTIGVVVNDWYTRTASADDTVVTVSKPYGSNFITGGGYLVERASAGVKAADNGTKGNFGFNVRYNKGGTNLQGSINTIIRRTEPDGRLHVYQIKGNVMSSLVVSTATCAGSPCGAATFNGKASIQDITDPLNPVSVDGNASLQVTITDGGEPGSSDKIGITIWNKSGGLWYASNWSGTKTLEQTLGGGNVVVR